MNGPPDPREHDALALLHSQLGGRLIDDPRPPEPPEYGAQRETAIDPDWDELEPPEYGQRCAPEDVPGLSEIMAETRRKPSPQLNPLVILCGAGTHVMGWVYRIPSALVLVGYSADREWDNTCERMIFPRRAARMTFAITLDATYAPRESDDSRIRPVRGFTLGCRCQHMELSVAEVNGLLATRGCPRRIRVGVQIGVRGRAPVALLPGGVRQALRWEDEPKCENAFRGIGDIDTPVRCGAVATQESDGMLLCASCAHERDHAAWWWAAVREALE